METFWFVSYSTNHPVHGTQEHNLAIAGLHPMVWVGRVREEATEFCAQGGIRYLRWFVPIGEQTFNEARAMNYMPAIDYRRIGAAA